MTRIIKWCKYKWQEFVTILNCKNEVICYSKIPNSTKLDSLKCIITVFRNKYKIQDNEYIVNYERFPPCDIECYKCWRFKKYGNGSHYIYFLLPSIKSFIFKLRISDVWKNFEFWIMISNICLVIIAFLEIL